MASVQERSVAFRNASRSDPPDFVMRWLSALKSVFLLLVQEAESGKHLVCESWRASPETETQFFHTRQRRRKEKIPSTSTRVPLSDSPWHTPCGAPQCGILQSLALELHWFGGRRTNCRDGVSVCLGIRHSNTSDANDSFLTEHRQESHQERGEETYIIKRNQRQKGLASDHSAPSRPSMSGPSHRPPTRVISRVQWQF